MGLLDTISIASRYSSPRSPNDDDRAGVQCETVRLRNATEALYELTARQQTIGVMVDTNQSPLKILAGLARRWNAGRGRQSQCEGEPGSTAPPYGHPHMELLDAFSGSLRILLMPGEPGGFRDRVE
jgi:hypothetical protein